MRAFTDPSNSSPLRRVALLGIAFVLAILSCGKDVTGPNGSARYARNLSFTPVFPPAFQAGGGSGSGVVTFTKVHVVLHHSDGTVALDTLIDFPAGADSLTLELTVKLLDNAPASGEPMTLNLGYLNAAGDVVFSGGPVSITAAPPAVPGQPNPPVNIPVTYTGPGASAVSVTIAPRTLSVIAGSGFNYTAVARDIGGNVLATTPIIWNSLDPAIASLASAAAGAGSTHGLRGTARIVAQLLTGAADTVPLIVTLPASQIIAQSGNAQAGTVGTNLTSPLVAKVAASDGVGVAGVTVNFAVASGGGSVGSASAISDTNGLAQTTFKLGSSVGAQSVTATSIGLTGSPLTFTATANAAVASKLVVTTQPVNGVAGIPLVAIVVTAQDSLGNTATTFSGNVTITFGANPTVATLAGAALPVTAVNGVATFSTLAINKNGAGYTLVASSTGLTSATTNTFDIAVGAPNKLVFTAQPSTANANAAITPAIVVNAQDSQGNATPLFTGLVTLGFGVNPSAASLGGVSALNAVGGVATFANVTVSAVGVGYTLTASTPALTGATSSAFNIGGGVATTLSVLSGAGQTAAPSAALALPVTVLVTNAGGSPIAGSTVNFAVLTGGGSVLPTSGVSNGAGQVQTTWTLGAPLGAQTMSATSAGLAGSPLTINATAAFAAATQLKFSVQPTNATAGVSIAPSIVVAAKDAGGALAGSFVGNVTLAISANPGGSTLSGTLTQAAVGGFATFNNISLDKAAAGYTLQATSGVLTPDVSAPVFTIVASAPANLAVSAGQGQSGLASAALGTPLAVLVTDLNANPVSGVTVNWAVTTGGGSVTTPTSVTNAAGIATMAWTLGAAAGAQTVTATSNGLAGSPLTFNATATLALANKTWTGATNATWTVATNWLPVGVPAATDSVFVPVSPNNPQIVANTTVASLYLASGTTLTLGGGVTLTDNGNLDATGPIIGIGAVSLGGAPGRTIKGSMSAALTVGGTYSLNGALVVTGTMAIQSGGALTLNGQTITQSGNFSTTASGTLTMQNAADNFVITGNATFGGGDESGLLTAGNLLVSGNFTQNSGANTFIAGANHTTVLNGAVLQTVNFANPNSSVFGGLIFSNSSTITLATNVQAMGGVQVLAGTVNGPGVGLSINGALTDAITGLNVTAISFGGAGPNPVSATTPIINSSVTFNGPSTLLANLTVTGTVNVNSALGVLTIGPNTLTVNGQFTTVNIGTVIMNVAGAALTVNGNAIFSGGASALTNGVLIVTGNFTQNTVANAFAATAPLITRFTGAAPTISFANPGTSNFGTVQFQTVGAVTFATGAVTAGPVWLKTGTTPAVTGAGLTVTVGGPLFDTTGGRWQVTNTVMSGSATVPRHITSNMTFSANAVMTDSAVVTGNVLVSGAGALLNMNGNFLSASGTFGTAASGVLQMANANDEIIVVGNASFNGGSTAGKLTNGLLYVAGNFTQGTTAAAFAADSPHETHIFDTTAGPLSHTVNFANPGFATSHFGGVYFADTLTVLTSAFVANGEMETGITTFHHIKAASDQLVISKGADVRDLLFDNVRWQLQDGYPVNTMDMVQFENISNTTATQFEMIRPTSTIASFTNWSFFTAPTGPGLYIKLTGPDVITMSNPFPSASGGFTSVNSGASLLGWPNTTTWTGGATTSAWNTPGNWDTGVVPGAAADVVIGASIYQPTTPGVVTIKTLQVNSGMTLTVGGGNMTVNGDITVQPGAAIALTTSNVGINAFGNVTTDTVGATGVTVCSGPSSPFLNLQAGTHTVTGKFCNLSSFGTYSAVGPIQVVGTGSTGGLNIGSGGSLNFNGNRVDVTSINTAATGTITMQNAADALYLHGGNASFSGGSETGLMTAGTVFDRVANFIVAGTGFDQSGGTGTVVVDTTFFQTLTWGGAVPGHGFNNLTMKGTSAKGFSQDQWITGTLLFDVSMVGPGTVSGSYNIHVNNQIDNSTITGGAWSGSTILHMTGNGTFNRDTLRVNTVEFDGGSLFTLTHNLLTNYMVVDSNSTLVLNGHHIDLQGNNFTTQHGGVLSMTTPGDSVIGNSFYFNGGNEVGALTNGGINVSGPVFSSFYQGYDNAHIAVPTASATSFASSGTRVWFNPSFGAGLAFANPGTGAGGSHFHLVQATNGANVTLLSDIFVDSLLKGEVSGDTWQSDALGVTVRTITTKGIYNSGTFALALKAVAIVLTDGTASSTFFNSVNWTNFPASYTGSLFTQNRSASAGPSIGLNSFSAVTITGAGKWINNIGTQSLFVGVSNIGITGSIICTIGGALLGGTSCP